MVTLAFAQAGVDARPEEPVRLDRRRGGPRARLRRRSRMPSSASSTRRTSTGSRSATPPWSSSSCAGRSTRRRAASGRRSARTSGASRCSACARSAFKLIVVRARVVPRDAGRDRLPAPDRRRHSRGRRRANFTLSLLVMVVLGGAGTRWGAMIGGVVYILPRPPARLASRANETVQDLPVGAADAALGAAVPARHALHPVVFFAPGGLAASAGAGCAPASAITRTPARAEEAGVVSVRIAWEVAARGRRSLLVHGLGYARWGWGPVADSARASGFGVRPLRQPRHRRERRAAGAVHGRGDGRRRAAGARRGRPRARARASARASAG